VIKWIKWIKTETTNYQIQKLTLVRIKEHAKLNRI
jgi:hypothetical protein